MEIIEHPELFSAIHFWGGSLDSQTKNTIHHYPSNEF